MATAKGASAPSSAAAAAQQGGSQASSGGGSLLESFCREGESSKRRRTMKASKSAEAIVSKCIKDNFKDWTEYQINCVKVGGQSLRERLIADKASQQAGGSSVKFGSNYYKSLKEIFSTADSPTKMLVAKDKAEVVSPALAKGLVKLLSANSDKNGIIEVLSHMTSINQKELVGTLKSLLKLKPLSSGKHREVIVTAMRAFRRLKLQDRFPEELALCRGMWDDCMLACWQCMKKDRVQLTTYMNIYPDILGYLFQDDDLATVVGCNTNWMSAEGPLSKLIESSNTGNALFGVFGERLISEQISTIIDSELNKLRGQSLTLSLKESTLCEILKTVEAKPCYHKMPAKREVSVLYSGFPVKVKVTTVHQEACFKIDSFAKHSARVLGRLDPLMCERDLVEDIPAFFSSVAEELLVGPREARKTCNELAGANCESSDDYLQLFRVKGQVLKQLDSSITIEMELFQSLVGEGGEQKLHNMVLEQLPVSSDKKPRPLDGAIANIQAITSTKIYSFVSVGAQGSVNGVLELLRKVQQGVLPKLDASVTSFMQLVYNRLENFCTYKDKDKLIFGKAALRKHFEMCSKSGSAPSSLADLEVFQTFKWLITDGDMKKQVGVWSEAVLKGQSGISVKTETSSGSTGKKKAHSKDDVQKMVDSFFS